MRGGQSSPGGNIRLQRNHLLKPLGDGGFWETRGSERSRKAPR